MPRAETDDEKRNTEEERYCRFERLVRVEPVHRGLAQRQTQGARDYRAGQESTQERDRRGPGALASYRPVRTRNA